jgi:hypothetical protein
MNRSEGKGDAPSGQSAFHRYAHLAPQRRDDVLDRMRATINDAYQCIIEDKDDMTAQLSDHLFGHTGLIADFVLLRRDPGDDASYDGLPFGKQDLLCLYENLLHRQPDAPQKIFDLPPDVLDRMEDNDRDFYETCRAAREQSAQPRAQGYGPKPA